MANAAAVMNETNATVKVSVIIPAYNATATLERTVRSVMAQTMEDWEAIIIDDKSSDHTLEMARELAKEDGRVKVLALDVNSRQSVARNAGFKAARGEWLAVLDADDAYEPTRLDVLVKHAEAKGLDMVADNQLFYDAGLGRVSRAAADVNGPVVAWTLVEHLREEKIGKSFKWGLLKPMVRREFLEGAKLSYRPQFHMGEDSLLYMELLACGAKAEVIPQPLYVYTTARGEISGVQSGMSTSRYKFDEHYATYRFFEDAFGTRLSVDEYAALRGCMRAAVNSEQFILAKADAKRGRFGAAVWRAMRRPGLLEFAWRSMARFVRYRLAHKVLGKLKRKAR